MITIVKFENILYPFLRSSKTLLIYVEFPRLFIQRRNALSSLDTRASSGKVSRKDICFVWVESPFLQENINDEFHISQFLTNKIKKKHKIITFYWQTKLEEVIRIITTKWYRGNVHYPFGWISLLQWIHTTKACMVDVLEATICWMLYTTRFNVLILLELPKLTIKNAMHCSRRGPSHLCWKIWATKARFRFGEPSTISFAVKYLLQPILSACSRTNFAVSKGFFAANVDWWLCSGASTFKRWA